MIFELPEYLPTRMLNEMAYCPRLFYLEWVQGEWSENEHTVWGKRMHRSVDKVPKKRVEKGGDDPPPVGRSIDIGDEKLRLIARIDVVEEEEGQLVPVDYKKGYAPDVELGAYEPERVQIAAQVMLLRASGYRVPYGVLYFAASRRRVRIELTPELEASTLAVRDRAFEVAKQSKAPPPLKDSPKCIGCSLAGICLPDEHALLLHKQPQTRLKMVRAQSVDCFPLHVTESGSVVRKAGEELVVETQSGEKRHVSVKDVSNLQLHGSIKITIPAITALMQQNAQTSYLSSGGWFYGRTQGPAHKNIMVRLAQKDPTNALLSYGYALLTSTWTEVVHRVGFDPYLGFYHQPRYGRPALSLDLMEEFRPVIVDSLVIEQIRRKVFDKEDFIVRGDACMLSGTGKKKLISGYERRIQTEVKHPIFGYKVQYRQVFEIQARLLGRYLMGEIEEFPEFCIR